MNVLRTQGEGVARSRVVFPRLHETGRLAKELGGLYDGGELITGLGANKSRLTQGDLNQYQQVVLATHGVLDRDVPYLLQPALVLSQVGLKDWLDGFLTLTDVMSLKLNCQTAALTSCQTELGREVSGEGVICTWAGASNTPGLGPCWFRSGAWPRSPPLI